MPFDCFFSVFFFFSILNAVDICLMDVPGHQVSPPVRSDVDRTKAETSRNHRGVVDFSSEPGSAVNGDW